MKLVLSLLGGASIIIVATLIFLLKEGVTIRPQPLIKPTEIKANFEPVGHHLFLRLFPEFQSNDLIIWRLELNENEKEKLVEDVLKSWENQFKAKPTIFNKWPNQLNSRDCINKCWIILDARDNFEDLKKQIAELQFNWIQIRTVKISAITEHISKECESQKILKEECIFDVSPHLVLKKLKNLNKFSFFMHKYLDRDFYLFIYNP